MSAVSALRPRTHEVFEATGAPYVRGSQYGAHFRETVRRVLTEHFVYHAEVLGLSTEALRERARGYRASTERHLPAVGEELRGAAASAGVDPDEIYVLAAFCELIYPHDRSAARAANHCTSFAARHGATSDGLTYVGQTDDDSVRPWLDGEAVTVVRYVPNDAPRALVYSYAGVPAQMGVNSAGLAVAVNALPYPRATAGVPMWCLVREVLSRKSVAEAVELVRETPRAYALNFLLADPTRIVNLETTPRHVEATEAPDLLVHSNHYRFAPPSVTDEPGTQGSENSRLRLERIRELTERRLGRLDLPTLEECLRDHAHRPDSICAHAGESPSDPLGRTFDAMVYVPEKREAWLTRGNPCENDFVRYAA
jgi:isopenicillin-N N-acyltransferase-like protein